MQQIYKNIIRIVDGALQRKFDFSVNIKEDNSVVSSIDLEIEKELINYFLGISENIVIIAEESYSGQQNWDFSDYNQDFVIIDPIDGTENFIFLDSIFGVAVSWRLDGRHGNMLYIPSIGISINDENVIHNRYLGSSLNLFSTKCIAEKVITRTDSARVMGSSSFMFSLLLLGKARSYTYCVGAKIWDCYTGLSLACQLGFDLDSIPSDYFIKPAFKQSFLLEWK